MRTHQWILAPILLLGLAAALAGCAESKASGRDITLAPMAEMPAEVRQAPTTVQEAYRFAVANPELVSQFPCFCGCGNMGHESNLDCYIQEFRPDGTLLFDSHALG
ncbi:MAG: hypothetical protein KAS81_07630 [Anaerolineales bacterium]|nr:hypothetical protein [Anaerolineales bacterium]